MPSIRYFAYGSNMEPATFRGRRGIAYTSAVAARAAGWRLVLDKPPLVPVGESFANIVAEPGAAVIGVLYEITVDELAHLDLTEGVLIGNYERVEIAVTPLATADATITAWTLVSDKRAPELLPSDRYMQCLIEGAVAHGLPAEWIAHLRGIPARPESTLAKEFRPIVDAVLRRPGTPE